MVDAFVCWGNWRIRDLSFIICYSLYGALCLNFTDLKEACTFYEQKIVFSEKKMFSDTFLIFEFNRGEKSTEAAWNCSPNVRTVFSSWKNVTDESTARKCFCHLKYGHFWMNNLPCSEILCSFDEEFLNSVINVDPCQSVSRLSSFYNFNALKVCLKVTFKKT